MTYEEIINTRNKALQKHANGDALTLEETALAIWDPDSGKKPMTTMGVLKLERRALEKLKCKLKEYGIKDLDDLFDPKHREIGHES